MVKRVALFFDDAELGSHLRAALSEHGAQIAHEGPLGSFDEAALRGAQVDVLVVNLDEAVDDAALDRIYGLVESGDIPVVFNDAQASRDLDGWDRARWARHLAAKALDHGSIDPPRPEDARAIETPAVATHVDAEPAPVWTAGEETIHQLDPSEQSETLAAELEALLATDEAQPVEDEFGAGLKYREEDELPPLHDGDFGWDEAAVQTRETAQAFNAAPMQESPSFDKPGFNINIDHLSLASVGEAMPTLAPAAAAQQAAAPMAPEWGFVEDSETAVSSGDVAKSGEPFGLEKMSAADYLAPAATSEEHESPIIPGMTLELVSIEEAIAPSEEYQPFETHLHELDSALSRLLVLGAARNSYASVSAFLANLPGDLKLPILLTQHQGDDPVEQLIVALSTQCALPVKLAAQGLRVKPGEVLVVPHGHQVRVTRDGRVDLSAANDDASGQSPSIDGSFTMAANVFGRDALAIVFAGEATDAIAGAQAIHDRGGQVWVESSAGDHYTDMVHGVLAERLASFSGSPQELALRVIEDFR